MKQEIEFKIKGDVSAALSKKRIFQRIKTALATQGVEIFNVTDLKEEKEIYGNE